MKLLLINPADHYASRHPLLQNYIAGHTSTFVLKHPSLSLLTVAGLTPRDVEIEYLDENVAAVDFDHDADLIGIGAMTQQAGRAYEIADAFRKRGKKVVLGGIHASVLPKEAIRHADTVIIGESENVWATFISDFIKKRAKKFYRGSLVDLKTSPIPRYDLIREFDFSGTPHALIPIQTSRGCPHNCSFCTVTHLFGRKIRTKSVPQIIKEIEAIFENCPFENRMIKLNDDNPFVNRRFAKELLEALIPLRIKWFSMADISIGEDKGLLSLLSRAGCIAVGIGFESVEPHVLRDLSRWKRKYLKTYDDSVNVIHDHGIAIAGSFMFGFDHDTEDSFKLVRDFVIEKNVLSKYSIVTPFPGTVLYDDLKRQDRFLKGLDWKYYNFLNVVFKTKMPAEKIVENLVWLYDGTWSQDVMNKIGRFNNRIVRESVQGKRRENAKTRRYS